MFLRNSREKKLKNWISKRENEAKLKDSIGMEDFFVTVLSAAQKIGEEFSSSKTKGSLAGSVYAPKIEAVSFELNAFLLHEIDLWLFLNKPDFRPISLRLQKSAVDLFSDIFEMDIDKVGVILNERLDLYGGLIREKKDVEIYLESLNQLILFAAITGNNKPTNIPDIQSLNSMEMSYYFEYFYIRQIVSIFYIKVIDGVRESLGLFCGLIEENFGGVNEYAIEWIETNGLIE